MQQLLSQRGLERKKVLPEGPKFSCDQGAK